VRLLLSALVTWHLAEATTTSRDGTHSAAGHQLARCAPDRCLAKRTLWDHMLQDLAPCLRPHRSWWSVHPPRLPVTLVTQLSFDRMSALKAQCQSWAGPLAAGIYVPLLDTERELSMKSRQRLQAAVAAAQEMMDWAEEAAASSLHAAMDLAAGKPSPVYFAADRALGAVNAEGGIDLGAKRTPGDRPTCQLRMVLMYEIFGQEKAVPLYPVNSLRNYARLLADTPLVANIDVDMLTSLSLSDSLLQGWDIKHNRPQPGATSFPGSAAELLQLSAKERTVFVLPAFETTCGGVALANQVSIANKNQMAQLMAEQCLSIFRYDVAPACHNATNFPRWLAAGNSSSLPLVSYSVQYEASFEPWFISSRRDTEWFDVRYRGYGKNKIQQVAHTAMRGAKFYVHPKGFIVHQPHPASAARKNFLRIKFKSRHNTRLLVDSLYQHVEDLWEGHQQELKAGTFQVTIDAPLAKCLRELPWWNNTA